MNEESKEAIPGSHLGGQESEFERRLYNARHGLADDATGGNLSERLSGKLLSAGGANLDEDDPDLLEDLDPESNDLPAELLFLTDEAPAEGKPARPTKRAYRPKASEAAKAYLRRAESLKNVPRLTIADPAEAIKLWKAVQHNATSGAASLPTLPVDAEEWRGMPIAVQVWNAIRATRGFLRWRIGEENRELRELIGPVRTVDEMNLQRSMITQETFQGEIVKWPLPITFFEPLEPLCNAEMAEIAKGRREIEEQLRREANDDECGRLMGGVTRISENA